MSVCGWEHAQYGRALLEVSVAEILGPKIKYACVIRIEVYQVSANMAQIMDLYVYELLVMFVLYANAWEGHNMKRMPRWLTVAQQ